jgi:hypothetical protein
MTEKRVQYETPQETDDPWRDIGQLITDVVVGTVQATLAAAEKKFSTPALAQPSPNGTKPQAQEFFDFLEFTGLKNRPAPEWLVYNFLPTKGESWLIGPRGEAKTYLSVGLTVAVASAIDWMGLKTRHGHVIYIAAEDIDEVAQRFVGCALHHSLQDIPNLHVFPAPIQLIKDTPKLIESIKHKYGDIDVALIIIDTQAMCTMGVSENAKDEFDAVTLKFELLWRTFKCCVLSVHHTGRNGELRGSSSMDAAAYSIIKVNKVDGYVRVHCEKSRRGKGFEDFYLGWETVELPGLFDEMGKQVTTSVLIPTDKTVASDPTRLTPNQQKLMDVLTVPMTHTKWREASGVPGRSFNDALKALLRMRMVEPVDPNNPRKGYQRTINAEPNNVDMTTDD